MKGVSWLVDGNWQMKKIGEKMEGETLTLEERPHLVLGNTVCKISPALEK